MLSTLVALAALIFAVPLRLERPATPTRLDVVDAPAVLRAAHLDVFGVPPSRARLAMAVGQVRLEGLALPGRNLGGLEYVEGRAWVRVDRLTRLRAFDTYPEAARAYWRTLAACCAGALASMDGGDALTVAQRLKAGGYYGVSVERYATGLRSLRR